MSQNVLGSCGSAGLRLTLTVAEMRPSEFFIDSYTVKINENVPSVTQAIRSQHLKYKQSKSCDGPTIWAIGILWQPALRSGDTVTNDRIERCCYC